MQSLGVVAKDLVDARDGFLHRETAETSKLELCTQEVAYDPYPLLGREGGREGDFVCLFVCFVGGCGLLGLGDS